MNKQLSITIVIALLLNTVSTVANSTQLTAKELAKKAIIVDTHIDAPNKLLAEWRDLGSITPNREFDYSSAYSGGLNVAFMSIYTSASDDQQGKAKQNAHIQIDSIEALIARHPDKFGLLTSPKDIETLTAGNRVLLALGMENGAPIEDDINQVGKFFKRGIRYIILAHSASNRISDSSYDPQRQWSGLSPFGKNVVSEMNRIGMIVDVSHLSDKAVKDVLLLSKVPVIASHSAFRHFTPGFERNISDELALAIAAKGGVIQISFGIPFINRKSADDLQTFFKEKAAITKRNQVASVSGTELIDEKLFDKKWWDKHPIPVTPIDAVLNQFDYAIKLVGIDHVGIGSDFDGVQGALPEGLKSVADYPNLVTGLQSRGYNDEQITKLLGGNFIRVWTEIESGAEKASFASSSVM